MEAVSPEELEALKYSELQRLAKTLGLKANLKADKLLNELKQHIHEIREIGSMNVTELIENEESQDAGSQKRQRRSQNECLVNSRMKENIDENSATPRSQKENCTMRKRVEGKTPVDYSLGKELCYSGSLSRSRKRQINATTPNFKKIHEAQFKKMQSIDDYMEKKKKRIYNFSNSVNKTKAHCSGFLLSPCPPKRRLSITPKNLKHTPHSNLSQKSAFISTGFSTTKMNVRFSESTKDNEHKRSLTKTPSRKSPFLNSPTSSSQKSNRVVTRKKLTGMATESSIVKAPTNIGVAPSKVTTQTQAHVSTKKPVFDLQASLSRPLHYQPHRGKLKPWGESKENQQYTCSHRRNYKQPLLQSRDERRKKHAQERKQRKDQVLETRRGLTIV